MYPRFNKEERVKVGLCEDEGCYFGGRGPRGL